MSEAKKIRAEIRQAIETGLVRQLLRQQVLTESDAAKIMQMLQK